MSAFVSEVVRAHSTTIAPGGRDGRAPRSGTACSNASAWCNPSVLRDEAEILVRSGDGGKGALAFRREKYIPEGGPAGGDGGRGGDVIFVATPHMNTLSPYTRRRHYKASHGDPGGGDLCSGRDGEDAILEVPCGTIIRLVETGELLADLTEVGQRVVVAAGGSGGKGNARFKSSVNQTPRQTTPGGRGV